MKYKGTSTEILMKQFVRSGYTFSSKSFEVIHGCLATDLDFNYKDVLHLQHVHKDFYCYFHSISDKSIVVSRFTEILKMKIPITLSSWEPRKNEHASLFNLFGFVVMQEYTDCYSGKLVLHVDYAYLSRQGNWLMTLYQSLPSFAAVKGFVQIAFNSNRKGWEKYRERTGFNGATRVFYKDLQHG